MKNFHNIQLALYSVIVASILVWLLVTLVDNAALAIGGYNEPSCDHTTPQPNRVSADDGDEEEEEEEEEEAVGYYQKLKEFLESTESIIMPPSDSTGGDRSNLIISDILPKTPRINVFSSLTRDFDPISSRLNNKSQNTTVLAPLNSAINDLPRKPWEDPEDYAKYGEVNAYKGGDGQERARRNLQRFVEAHLVPVSPWAEGEELETVGGGKVKWIKEGDRIFIEPGHIEVDTLTSQVSNGEVWVLKGVINYK